MKNIIFLAITALTISCKPQGIKNIFLIPKGFTGVVIVIFDQKSGTKTEMANGKIVFRIPANGILKTQTKPYYEIKSNEYFFIDSFNKRTAIKYLPSLNEKKSGIGAGFYCFSEQMGSTPINKPNVIKFRTFLVGSSSQADSLYNIKNKKIFEEVFNWN